MKKQFPLSYQNGNVKVTIHSDGTKVREWPDNEEDKVDMPESMDVKITNFCDLGDVFDAKGNLIRKSKTCPFCHEASNNRGKHADLSLAADIIGQMNTGSEVALGGGAPFKHPDIFPFLERVSEDGIIANVTNNIIHMKRDAELIETLQKEKLVHGMGVSYRGKASMKMLPTTIDYTDIVFHFILGLQTISDVLTVREWCLRHGYKAKILFLGYKTFRNGGYFYSPIVQKNIDTWKNGMMQYTLTLNDVIFSFDNLGISQMDLKTMIPDDIWSLHYQGEEGTHSMYIDAVSEVYARNSTSDVRDTIRGKKLQTMFNNIRSK